MGCYQFIIELLNSKIISYQKVDTLLNSIMTTIQDTNTDNVKVEILVDCLCRIYKCTQQSDNIDIYDKKQIYIIIKEIYDTCNKHMKSRSKFILEDVVKCIEV